MGQVTGNPLDDWTKLAGYKFPDPDDPVFWEGTSERARLLDMDAYVKTSIFMVLFERLHSLRGFENVMLDFYLEREKLENLTDRIVEFDLGIIRNTARRFPGIIDGISFSDDWGTEQAAFISVELFDEFFKPRYKKIFNACHEAGWHVWLHSCGKVTSLIPSLIDAGVDVFNLQQPRVLGIEDFGTMFAGETCFSTCADIQHTLPFKSVNEIEDEVKLLLEYWATPQGGYIVSDYGDSRAIGVSDAAKKAMFDAYQIFDPFKQSKN
jgi:uroporphyrinogen-III decarboxylase